MLGDEDFDANVVFYGRQVPICCLSDPWRYNHFQFDQTQRLQEVTALHSETAGPSDLLPGLFLWCPLLLYCLSTPSAIYWSHFVVFLVTKLITFQALISQLHLRLPACEIALCCFNVRHSKRSLKRSVNSPIKWKMFFCVVTLCPWVNGCTINDCILIASWEKHRSCFVGVVL